jgi:hypothetical protein
VIKVLNMTRRFQTHCLDLESKVLSGGHFEIEKFISSGTVGAMTKKIKTAKNKKADEKSAAKLIDARIKELRDWRGQRLSQIRALIKESDPGIIEEWKWSVPVWSCNGIICTGEVYKNVVKMTFPKGASLKDPSRLFNSSLEGNVRRAIDLHEDNKINEKALKDLIREAVNLNKK